MADEAMGYYDLYQLSTVRGSSRVREHVGRYPTHPRTILRKVARGEFPQPIRGNYKNIWKKEVIHRYDSFVEQGMSLAEAAAAAEGV